jgi:hypothetical protein
MLSASVSALLPGAALLLYKPDRKYTTAVIMGAVLYPLTAALFSISACSDFSHLTVMFVSDACAVQSAARSARKQPPARQEEQEHPTQPPRGKTGPKPPEALPLNHHSRSRATFLEQEAARTRSAEKPAEKDS